MARIKAPLLIHYAEKDDRINAGIPAFEAALKANHVNYEMFTYPGTQHGFNNDTTPRYDKAAAARLAADHGLFQEESTRLTPAQAWMPRTSSWLIAVRGRGAQPGGLAAGPRAGFGPLNVRHSGFFA